MSPQRGDQVTTPFEKWWEDPRVAEKVAALLPDETMSLAAMCFEAGRREGLRVAWLAARDTCHDVAAEYPAPESHLILHVNDRALEAIGELGGDGFHPGAALTEKTETPDAT